MVYGSTSGDSIKEKDSRFIITFLLFWCKPIQQQTAEEWTQYCRSHYLCVTWHLRFLITTAATSRCLTRFALSTEAAPAGAILWSFPCDNYRRHSRHPSSPLSLSAGNCSPYLEIVRWTTLAEAGRWRRRRGPSSVNRQPSEDRSEPTIPNMRNKRSSWSARNK